MFPARDARYFDTLMPHVYDLVRPRVIRAFEEISGELVTKTRRREASLFEEWQVGLNSEAIADGGTMEYLFFLSINLILWGTGFDFIKSLVLYVKRNLSDER